MQLHPWRPLRGRERVTSKLNRILINRTMVRRKEFFSTKFRGITRYRKLASTSLKPPEDLHFSKIPASTSSASKRTDASKPLFQTPSQILKLGWGSGVVRSSSMPAGTVTRTAFRSASTGRRRFAVMRSHYCCVCVQLQIANLLVKINAISQEHKIA